MKRSIFILLISFLSANLYAQNYGLDNADLSLFSRYRIPETTVKNFMVQTDLNYTSTHNNVSQPNQKSNSLSTILNYSLAPQYFLRKESDDNSLFLNISANGTYVKQSNKDQSTTTSYPIVGEGVSYSFSENDYHNSRSRVVFDITSSYRNYLNKSMMFYALTSDMRLGMNDEYYTNSLSKSDNRYYGNKNQNYDFQFGIGWGKYRDVTPVVTALRFQQRLKQLNLLNNDLSSKAVEDLAEQFSRQNYYSNVYNRPDKYFWRDIEKVLINDNIVSLNSLNQYANSYLREVPNEMRFIRNEGLASGIGLEVNYVNNYYSDNYNSYDPHISEELYTLANAYVQFSHQLNLNSQFGFLLSASGGPNLIKNSVIKQRYVLNAQLRYDYELTDRIVTSVEDNFSLGFYNYDLQKKSLYNSVSLGLNYFIEDNVLLKASYNWKYSDDKHIAGINNFQWSSNNYVNLGITYYFDRGILYM
ncbi:MAG: hypothetical protein ACM3MI_06405 [Clostridiales bacterium]